MNDNNSSQRNKYIKLFAISSQLTATVIGFALLGYGLDYYFEVEKNYFTLGLSLLGVFLGLYVLYQDVKKLDN